MNRRLMIRVGLACVAVCVLGWKLPGMLDGALSSIDQHKGTMSLLTGAGHTIGAPGADQPRGEVTVLGAASSLSPAERAKLIEAAKKRDPLTAAQAKLAARTPAATTAAKPVEAPPPPAETAAPAMDPAILSALRALGMDPQSMDLKTIDIDALLAQARGQSPKD